jgi:hypothetical protein
MKKFAYILAFSSFTLTIMMNFAQQSTQIGRAQAPTPTTAPLILPTIAPLPTIGVTPENTPLPTFTPTEPGPVQLEAKERTGAVNVRLQADPNAELLGPLLLMVSDSL